MKLNTIMKKRSDRLSRIIGGGLEHNHMTNKEAACKAGISERTFNNRKKEPMTLTLGELYRLCDAFGLVILIKEKEDVC